jgi:hypothetical protein
MQEVYPDARGGTVEQRDRPHDERRTSDEDCDPVDHDRTAGVPPESSEDVESDDQTSADSFPASDPPANY